VFSFPDPGVAAIATNRPVVLLRTQSRTSTFVNCFATLSYISRPGRRRFNITIPNGKLCKEYTTLLLLLGDELPLMVESFSLLNDIFPFPSILDAGYPVFNIRLANILFDVILPSVLGIHNT